MSRPASAKYVLPGRATSADPGEWLVATARPLLYELLGRTKRADREYGLAVWADIPSADGVYATRVEEGQSSSVTTPDPEWDAPVRFAVHTHPIPGIISPSRKDWSSVARHLFQYPVAAREAWQGQQTMRGFCILTQRSGDADAGKATLRVLYALPPADDIGINRSRELSREMMNIAIEETYMDRNAEMLDRFSRYIGQSIVEVELPDAAERLHIRSAVPETVDDRRWGIAIADGDMTDVLRGVTYR